MKKTATFGRGAGMRKSPAAPAKSEPAPGIAAPNSIGYCTDCHQRRYARAGKCLQCGKTVAA